MRYTFSGPGTYVFPELAGPPGSGTLTAVPGQTYDFEGDPPGPAQWWGPVASKPAGTASPAAGTGTGTTTPAVPDKGE